jgi:hypothetical protein
MKCAKIFQLSVEQLLRLVRGVRPLFISNIKNEVIGFEKVLLQDNAVGKEIVLIGLKYNAGVPQLRFRTHPRVLFKGQKQEIFSICAFFLHKNHSHLGP